MALIISPFSEADTLATVTGRGASTTTAVILNGGLSTGTASTVVTRAMLTTQGDFLSYYAAETTARIQLGRDVGVSGGAALALGGSTYALIAASDTSGTALYFKLSAATGTASTSPNMALTATGLGIGTASPAYKLEVNGTLGVTGATSLGGDVSTGLGVTTGNASIELGGSRTGDGNSFIDFHSTASTDYEFRIIRSGGLNGNVTLANAGTGVFTLQQVGAGTMVFNTNAAERMRITTGGNIGIGVVPTQKLEVAGTIYSSTGGFKFPDGTTQTTAASGTATTTYVRTVNTATASQTVFSATYTVGYLEVYLNGLLLPAADYTATNGTSVTLSVACAAGDIVETIAYAVAAIGTGVTTGKAIAMAMIFGG